jgi:hypothetical protein
MGISATSDIRRYEVKTKVGDAPSSPVVTTELRIEAAGEIVLTQAESSAGVPGHVYVPPTPHLTVLGDVVTIDGRLNFPGRVVKIVARRIVARCAEGKSEWQWPGIIVDGAELDRAIREPRQLDKGVTPARLAPLRKVAKGTKGDDAVGGRAQPYVGDPGGVEGKPGWSAGEHPREMHGEPGENGVPGNPGGAIILICRELSVLPPKPDAVSRGPFGGSSPGSNTLFLFARGGTGGDGQQGQDGAEGGDGGEPFDARDGVGFASVGFQLSQPGGPGGHGGNGGRGGNAGAGGNGGSIIVYTKEPISPLTAVFAYVEAGSRGRAGQGGARGEGGRGAREAGSVRSGAVPGQPKRSNGDPGLLGDQGGNPEKDGVNGSKEINPGKAGSAFLAAVSVPQLAMMTDRVRSSFLCLDPEAEDNARVDVLDRMEWLSMLLESVPSGHLHYPIARSVVLEVQDAKDAIRNGRDWFGNGPGYVPSVSVGRLNQDLTRQLQVLNDLETLNNEYIQALIHQKGTSGTIQNALSAGGAQLAAVAAEFTETRGKLEEEAEKIKQADNERKAAREPLEKALVNFSAKVQESFGPSAETLFNALSQLSFTSPQNPAGAALMGVSQIGTVLNEGMKNILDDTGRPIEKGYVLGEVKRLSSPDITLDLRHYADGRFAEEPIYSALVEYDKIKQLIQRFASNTGGAQTAIDQINKVIDLVLERNRHVDFYNSLLLKVVELNTLERRLKLRQQISRDSLSRVNPSLDQVTDFVSALYETSKQDCLKALYLLYRAQSFWSLQPLNGFHNLVGASPIGLVHGQLNAAAGRLTSTLTDNLERIRRTPNRFPKKDDAVGVPVVLTREKHPFIFNDLIMLGSAEFRIAPATRRSPNPGMWEPTAAVSSCDVWLDPNGPNPFHGRADVRLTKIRVWLVGFKTSSPLHIVRIDHLGSELFCAPGNVLYPQYRQKSAGGASGEPGRVYHTGLQVPFIYSPDGLRGPEAHGGFQPGKLDVDGAEDGDLNFSANVGLGLGMQDCYAAVGPFADWRLVVDDQNTDASWDQLHTIVIDFHGFHQTF